MSDLVVKTVEELKGCPEEYREAVSKLVISHAINELYGAQVFDEPAIALAPSSVAFSTMLSMSRPLGSA